MATNDGGVDWALRLTIGGDEYGWGDLSFVTPSTGFVVGPTHYAPEDLYRTDDGGATWKIVPIDGSACTSAQLGVSAGTKGVGLGHVGIPLVFRNVSDQACTLSGYPGVAGLDVHGSQTIQATRTPKGYLGGLTFSSGGPVPAVDLQPGATASALVEGTDTTEPACPIYPSLLVTAPNTFQSVSLDIEMPGCTGLQVHPVVPGSSGSEAQ